MILPGMGIISELLTVHARRKILGYRAIAYSSIAIALIGFLVWGHHMFVAGQSELAATIFSALTFLVAVPSGIKMFNWILTLWRGSVAFTAPMLWAMSFLFLFAIGGLPTPIPCLLSTHIPLPATRSVLAHLHYRLIRGPVMAVPL